MMGPVWPVDAEETIKVRRAMLESQTVQSVESLLHKSEDLRSIPRGQIGNTLESQDWGLRRREAQRHGVVWDKLTPPYHSCNVPEKESSPLNAVILFKAHFLVNNQKGGRDFNGMLRSAF